MKGPGYDAANPITPYIHVMVYHCPTLLRRYGNIKMFTGQGNTIFLVLSNRTAKLWNQINISSDGKNFAFLYSYWQVLKRKMMMWEEIFIVRSTDGIHVHPCWLWKNDKRICFKAKGRSAAIQKQIRSTGTRGGRAMLQKNSPEFLLNCSVLRWHKIVKRFHKKRIMKCQQASTSLKFPHTSLIDNNSARVLTK